MTKCLRSRHDLTTLFSRYDLNHLFTSDPACYLQSDGANGCKSVLYHTLSKTFSQEVREVVKVPRDVVVVPGQTLVSREMRRGDAAPTLYPGP